MERKILIILLLFCFFPPIGFGYEVEFFLVGYSEVEHTLEKKIAIIENQIEPIIKAFGFDVDISLFEQSAKGRSTLPPGARYVNSLEVLMNIEFPGKDMGGFEYSIIRNGVELNRVDNTVERGDTIRFKAKKPKEEPEMPSTPHDWTTPGGDNDTPPIEMVSLDEFEKIHKGLEDIYFARYPWAWGPGSNEDIPGPIFNIERTPFNERTSKYTGALGRTAYVVPARGNKKMGIQLFCNLSILDELVKISEGMVISKSVPGSKKMELLGECPKNEFDGFDCIARAEGEVKLPVTTEVKCLVFIDKIIEGGEAIQADWLSHEIPLYPYSAPMKFNIISGDKKPPVADFECEIIEENNEKFLECDASQSYDPDGEIVKYEWGFSSTTLREGWVKQRDRFIFDERYPMERIILKVTDNDGIWNKKIKTIDVRPKPIIEFTALYNPETQKAELTLECPRERTALVDIDQYDKQANPTLAVIEKQAIECNKTTEIGPIKTKGYYQARAELEGTEMTAVFTIQ